MLIEEVQALVHAPLDDFVHILEFLHAQVDSLHLIAGLGETLARLTQRCIMLALKEVDWTLRLLDFDVKLLDALLDGLSRDICQDTMTDEEKGGVAQFPTLKSSNIPVAQQQHSPVRPRDLGRTGTACCKTARAKSANEER